MRRRTRSVLRAALGKGRACGSLGEEEPCGLTACEDLEGQEVPECVWGEWSEFGECDVPCGRGRRRSSRAVRVYPRDAQGRSLQQLCVDSERFEACELTPCRK